jgi:hypothetical protein
MDFGIYQNSYLKRFDAIKKHNETTHNEIKVLKSKPIIDYINEKKLIDQNKVQEYKNYINKKNTPEVKIDFKSEYEYKNNNKYKEVKQDSYSNKLTKDGYMSRDNKEPVLNNRSTFGYETIINKDIVSISRPIYWPDRGYTEKTVNNNYFKTFYYQ